MIRPKFTPLEKAAILEALLEMRRSGKLQGVWYSDSLGVQVRTLPQGSPDYIPWHEAAELAGYQRQEPECRIIKFVHTLRPIKHPKRRIA